MPGTVMVGLLILAALAIYLMLTRISALGGASDGDAAATANQILGETDAFGGSRSSDDPPWDGHNRLAPPTQVGGGVGG